MDGRWERNTESGREEEGRRGKEKWRGAETKRMEVRYSTYIFLKN